VGVSVTAGIASTAQYVPVGEGESVVADAVAGARVAEG
jgi:hypothetical protein